MAFVLAVAAALWQQPPDRSGEPALRKIMSWAKSLDNVHIVILPSSRETGSSPMYPGDRIDVWIKGARFRVEISSYWGYGSYVVSDGKTVLSDSTLEWSPAILAKAGENLLASYANLKIPNDDVTPFFGLMGGPSDLDKLVPKAEAIKLEPATGVEKSITFVDKKRGTQRLFFREGKGSPQLDRIEYDNLPALRDAAKADPEDNDDPDPGTLTRNEIYIAADRPGDSLFSTSPPKGREVTDRRKG